MQSTFTAQASLQNMTALDAGCDLRRMWWIRLIGSDAKSIQLPPQAKTSNAACSSRITGTKRSAHDRDWHVTIKGHTSEANMDEPFECRTSNPYQVLEDMMEEDNTEESNPISEVKQPISRL